MRDADKRIVRLKEGEPRGRHVVIVDDLVQSGGTLIECQKLLASQVFLAHSPACAMACNDGKLAPFGYAIHAGPCGCSAARQCPSFVTEE